MDRHKDIRAAFSFAHVWIWKWQNYCIRQLDPFMCTTIRTRFWRTVKRQFTSHRSNFKLTCGHVAYEGSSDVLKVRCCRNCSEMLLFVINVTGTKVIQMNQLDATVIYWSIRSAQRVSGNILPIIRSVRLRFLQHMVSCCCGGQGDGEWQRGTMVWMNK